jgi:hypothetical protein
MSASASYLTFMGFLLPIAVDLVGPVESDEAAGVADVGKDTLLECRRLYAQIQQTHESAG